MAITPLPPAPEVTDDTATFNTKAFAWVNAIDDFTTEANALAVQANTDAGTATTQAGIATTQAGIATTKAGEASDDADAAAASAFEAAGLVENYQGALSSDPSLNKDGDPLAAGDWYVNTSTGLIRAYTGSVWVTSVNVTAGVTGFSAGTTGLTPSTNTTGEITLAGTLGVANGGTGATSLTGVLKGNGTSAVTASNVNLASEVTGTLPAANGGTGLTSPGTAGNVLTSDGTGWTSAAAAGGAWEYISSVNVTTPVAFVDIDHAFSTDYDLYVITANNLAVQTAVGFIDLNVKNVSGVDSTVTNYLWHLSIGDSSSSSYGGINGNGSSAFNPIRFVGTSAISDSSFVLFIHKPAGSGSKIITSQGGSINGDFEANMASGSCMYKNSLPMTGIRFTPTYSFTRGSFNLYRVKKS